MKARYLTSLAVLCSQFIREIPFGGKDSNGKIREDIFRQKIDVIKQFKKAQDTPK